MNMGDNGNENISTAIPKYGLKLKLSHVYPDKCDQKYIPRISIIWSMLPLICRYLIYYLKLKWKGKRIVMDYVYPNQPKPIYGVPIGGIGSGTIGRGYRGEFCRFQIRPGIYEWNTVEADQFIITIKDENNTTILQTLLSTFPRSTLSSWENNLNPEKCYYTGLYPRAWIEYDLSEYGVYVICRQISPVIPHDYNNTCLPCAVFVWDVKNITDKPRTVTIAFTFKNGTGSKADKNARCSSKDFKNDNSEGVILYHTIDKINCAYALAVRPKNTISISKCLYFDPNSDGSDLWCQLKENGEFKNTNEIANGKEIACGIAAKFIVPPGNSEQVDMSLVWDMPTVLFPNGTKSYDRFYTKQFGKDNAALKVVTYAFQNYESWENSIFNWQKEVLEDSKLPDWYKGALFNETYYLTDGGALWLIPHEEKLKSLSVSDPRTEYGHFAYLEGQEYIMYNSYDVHFYASHALHKNWPILQKCLQYDLKDFYWVEIDEKVTELYNGRVCDRKKKESVPHDAGNPGEEPFSLINAYPIHDVSEWKDLNSKFILQIFRDAYGAADGNPDVAFISDMYDTCNTIIKNALRNEVDEDGLIQNGGIPDQTYDSWVMSGVSAYCGGLWLAALHAMSVMAELLSKENDKHEFENILCKASAAFETKMWNGKYYNFDCSADHSKAVMADQLCGHWYLKISGLKNCKVFPENNVKTALKTIYKSNVELFCNGKKGAVNGTIDGEVDETSIQSLEVWTGVTYALASTMIMEGMVEEGFKTAGGMYNAMMNCGLAFNTPEALYAGNHIRAVGYMRPLSIWSMQIAWERFNKK